MSKKSLLISASALLFLLPAGAFAQTAGSLNADVTVTSLRTVPYESVTSAVTVLDQVDLDIRNSPNVADQLRSVPSLGVSRSGSTGGLTQIRLRGSESNHTLVLLNGIEISDPVTGATDFGILSGLNPSRIEVVRGEQSGLYGSDAIGGVVSIETDREGLSASAEAGSFGTVRGQFDIASGSETAKFNLALSGYQTDGVDTSGTGGGKDGSTAVSVLTGGELALNSDWTLGGLATYRRSESDFDPDTNFDGRIEDADRETLADHIILGLSLDGDSGIVNHSVRANYTEIELRNSADGQVTGGTEGERTKFSYSPSVEFGNNTQGVVLSGLADWEREDYENAALSEQFDSYGLGLNAVSRYNNATFNASVRYDDNDNRFEDVATWRLAGGYTFGRGGKIRAAVGSGVKNPTFPELFGFGSQFFGNPDLEPERSESWEIGYDQSFAGKFNASVTYYEAELEDEIIYNDFFNGVINRNGDSERSGVEISADWQLTDSVSLVGMFSKITSENDAGDDEIRVPENTAGFTLNWNSQNRDGFTAGMALDYVGEQGDTFFQAFPLPALPVTLDSYTLVSANMAYPINDDFAVTLRGENLLDETVQDVFSYTNTGAGVFVGFKLR